MVRPARLTGPAAGQRVRRRGLLSGGAARTAGLWLCLALLVVVCLVSLRVGSVEITTSDAIRALTDFDGSDHQTIVRSLRLPRTLVGVAVGAALAVAGTIIQAMTRNPLADPGILGINAGAAFAIVTAVYLFGAVAPTTYVWFAFAGALGAASLVFAVGAVGRGGPTPLKLTLSGAVTAAVLSSWTSTILVLDQRTTEEVRYWLAGSLVGRDFAVFWSISPFLGAATLLGLATGWQLNTLSLGDEVASALGQRVRVVRAAGVILVVVLAGSAVAAAGPIAFVGLAVPHIVRALVGPDYRWVLAYGAVLGPVLLLCADIVGRVAARPSEVQVGIVTALLGAPVLIVLARRRPGRGLTGA